MNAPLNEPRPSVGRPLSEAIAALMVERREIASDLAWCRIGTLRHQALMQRADEASERLDDLLRGVAAHVQEWAHFMGDCPICAGEVTL